LTPAEQQPNFKSYSKIIKGSFSLIDACLKEKMKALKSKDSTDE